MKIEVMRLFVPRKMIINDNSQGNYKQKMPKTKWLTSQAQLVVEGFVKPCDFKMPEVEAVHKIVYKNEECRFKLILEHFKCQQTYDVSNYDQTFKYLIDVLTANGYWEDDNWKFAHPVVYTGGDYSVWKERAFRYEGDGLPENIKKDWWIENGMNPRGDSFVRVIVSDDLNI